MIIILLLTLILIIIPILLMTINMLISKKSNQDREKISPFECGFDPLSPPRLPFSIQFFFISLMFLIFDVEIALLIPLIKISMNLNLTMIISSIMFILILILELYTEYLDQSINWKI